MDNAILELWLAEPSLSYFSGRERRRPEIRRRFAGKAIIAITPCSTNMVTVRVCSKLKTRWKSVVFTNTVGKNPRYFVGVSDKTIIPLALVGYEMIIANSALFTSLAIYHLISNAQSWNNCELSFSYLHLSFACFGLLRHASGSTEVVPIITSKSSEVSICIKALNLMGPCIIPGIIFSNSIIDRIYTGEKFSVYTNNPSDNSSTCRYKFMKMNWEGFLASLCQSSYKFRELSQTNSPSVRYILTTEDEFFLKIHLITGIISRRIIPLYKFGH